MIVYPTKRISRLFAHKFHFVVYSSLPKLPQPSIYIQHRQRITLAELLDNFRLIFPTAVDWRLLFSFDLLGSLPDEATEQESYLTNVICGPWCSTS